MDANGSRHLLARLAVGVPVGSRFEVTAVEDGQSPLAIGDTGTLVSVEAGRALVRADFHGELEIDPHSVTLRPLLQKTA
jgi:hypothetical protein